MVTNTLKNERAALGTGRILLAGIVIVIGIGTLVTSLVLGLNNLGRDTHRFDEPGTSTLSLSKSGAYTVFLEVEKDGGSPDFGKAMSNVSCSVVETETGAAMALQPNRHSRYSVGKRMGVSVWRFKVTEAAPCTFTAMIEDAGDGQVAALVLKRGLGAAVAIIVAGVVVPLLGTLFAVLAILGLFSASPQERNAAHAVALNREGVGAEVLSSTSRGQYEGTWTLPIAYEGSLWDRFFGPARGTWWRCNAAFTLTRSTIHIRPWVGENLDIPAGAIAGVYTCATTGGKYWGRDAVLKVVWRDGDDTLCTGLAFMLPVRKMAAEWKDAIMQLAGDTIEAEMTANAGAVEYLRRENRLMTIVFWLSLIIGETAWLTAPLVLGHRLNYSPLHSVLPFAWLFVWFPVAKGLYMRRYRHAGLAIPAGPTYLGRLFMFFVLLFAAIGSVVLAITRLTAGS